ncbi:LacI family DNA-binding transcriptional regulator [Streptomyces sp. VN1]|nr:LacI family DNA-binding transcriptional regulator [Streptomyces sp. VN1]
MGDRARPAAPGAGTVGGLLVRAAARTDPRRARRARDTGGPARAPRTDGPALRAPPRTRHADHRVPAGPEGTDSCVHPGPSAPRPALTAPPGLEPGQGGRRSSGALGKRGWVVAGPSSGATASPEGCGRVTLSDVAALAGVSVSPVSSVVHARVSVREQTRRRVREAAGQLGCLAQPGGTTPAFGTLADDRAGAAQRHCPVRPRPRGRRAARRRGPRAVRAHDADAR